MKAQELRIKHNLAKHFDKEWDVKDGVIIIKKSQTFENMTTIVQIQAEKKQLEEQIRALHFEIENRRDEFTRRTGIKILDVDVDRKELFHEGGYKVATHFDVKIILDI